MNTKNYAEVNAAGEELVLLPERAVYWEKKKILFIADTHFGKTASFQKNGISVTQYNINDDLKRLTRIIQITEPLRLIILGDLLHAKSGRSDFVIERLLNWRMEHLDLHIMLIRGNHDRHSGDPPGELNFECCDDPCFEKPFMLKHEPAVCEDKYIIAGHVHPSVNLKGKGRQKAKLPCFYFGEHFAVLPAFGSFTGTYTVIPESEDKVFVIAGEEVIAVS